MADRNNYLNNLASMIALKHGVDLQAINQILNKAYEPVTIQGINEDELHLYDRFMATTQREKTGSYYTPFSLAVTMVKIAFKDYFNGHHIEGNFFEEPYPCNNDSLYSALRAMKIVDIACGTGVFLLATIHVLKSYFIALNHKVSVNEIVDQLEGYDLQNIPLEVLDLLVLDLQLSDNCEYKPIETHCVDTVLHSFSNTYDLVIGNPPYVGEKGNKALFDNYKHVNGYEGRMDLFYFFIYKGYEILKPNGLLHFITTNYFVTADGAMKLRQYLKEHQAIKRMINLDECKLFADAKGMHNMIFTLSKAPVEHVDMLIIGDEKVKNLNRLFDVDYTINTDALFSETGNINLYEDTAYYSIIDKMKSMTLVDLSQLVDINQGIVSGADKVTQHILNKKLIDEKIKKDQPIYVFDEQSFESEHFKPFYKNSQIKPYKISLDECRWILYVNNISLEADDLAYKHLKPFKPLLEQRREVISGARKWYELQWGRKESIFTSPKIVVPQRAQKNIFGYTEAPFYSSADVYYLTNGPLKFLLGILNSKLYYFWLYNRGKRKGKSLELYAKPLSQIPIPTITDNYVVTCVEEILDGRDRKEDIDQWLYEYFDLSHHEINLVEALYKRG